MHGEFASHSILFSLFLIFSGAALLATAALYLRQAMLIAYLALGALFGPWGLGLVSDADLISEIAQVGIIFLLFLLGLNLSPQKLLRLLRETTWVTLLSGLIFAALAAAIAAALASNYQFTSTDIILIGLAATFSSTIVGLKLLPTTVLHHRHTGEVIISVLLLQDLIAIVALLVVHGMGMNDVSSSSGLPVADIARLLIALPVLGVVAWGGERFLLLPLFCKFDRLPEYLFLLAIGWCLGLAQLAQTLGLSYEIGAFAGGIALAANPIAAHISEKLKPLRDFFLVLFFFAIGAGFNLIGAWQVALPAALIALALLAIKPVVFRFLLVGQAKTEKLAWETGVRLGQMSEFSLLIVFVARQNGVMSEPAFYTVQLATLLCFVISVYWIVFRYPTPIALSDDLRRD